MSPSKHPERKHQNRGTPEEQGATGRIAEPMAGGNLFFE